MSRTQIDPSLVPASQNSVNMLDNAGFDIWQRGTSFSNPASGTMTADRWALGKTAGVTVNITQEASIVDIGLYSVKVDTTVATGTQTYINQNIENFADFKGRTVTFSARVRTSTANKIRLAMADGVSQTFSSYHTGGGTFETLSMTFTLNASATVLTCYVGMVADTVAVSTFYVDGCMLVSGTNAAPYKARHPEEELARCQRYYETGSFFDTKTIQRDSTGGGRNRARSITRFSVTKAIVPTVTTTLTGVTLCHFPTTGSAESSDTANWTISGGSTVDRITTTAQRNTDQTTFPQMELLFTWTATADV